MLRRLLSRIARAIAEPEPEAVRHLRDLARLLNERAARFRDVATRATLLRERVGMLAGDLAAWERRVQATRDDPRFALEATRICGRLEGQLQETNIELGQLESEEAGLRTLLTRQRGDFVRLVERAKALGYDVSECLLYIDLSAPERVADVSVLVEEDRDFVARVIDSSGAVH